MMRIVITGGPSSEPIDRVRQITNQSTGELAVLLAQKLLKTGNDVQLFLGSRSIFRVPMAQFFETNEDLEQLLGEVVQREKVSVVLHAAALADFWVANVVVEGMSQGRAKISSGARAIQLRLEPKSKLIARLRYFFPNAFIVGWKFELDGTPEEVVGKGLQQIAANQTDVCIVNGSAFGAGFGYCDKRGLLSSVRSKLELVDLLSKQIEELRSRLKSVASPGR